jgi:hypothetical protein
MHAVQTAKFSCLLGIAKGTLLGEQSTFPAVFRLTTDEFSSKFKPRTFHVCATKGIGLVAIDGQLRVENTETFRLYFGFHQSHFPQTTYLAFSTRALQAV